MTKETLWNAISYIILLIVFFGFIYGSALLLGGEDKGCYDAIRDSQADCNYE